MEVLSFHKAKQVFVLFKHCLSFFKDNPYFSAMILNKQSFLNSWPFLLGLILGLYFVVFNLTGLDFAYFPGDLGDGRFNTYILEHGHKFLTGQVPSLWNAPYFYPAAEVITFSDNLIGTVPIYSLFRGFGCDVETAFQSWFVTLAILNYTTCYFFLKAVTKNQYAAVLGAFVFAFSMALQSQMTHAQVFPRFFIPLCLWMLVKFKASLHPKYLFLATLFLVLQFYAGIYLGFMLAIPFGIMLLLILFVFERKHFFQIAKQFRWWLFTLIGAGVNMFFLATLMLPYFERSKSVGVLGYDQIVGTIPSLRSFFFSQEGSLLWDGLSQVGIGYDAFWDHQLFPGILTILSVIIITTIVILRKRISGLSSIFSPTVWLLLITAGTTFLLFFRYQGYSLYKLVHVLPGFGSMRSLTRVINVELVFFALFVCLVACLLFIWLSRYKVVVFIGFLSCLVVDNYFFADKTYRTDKNMAQSRVETLKEKFEHIPTGEIVSYEPEALEDPHFFYQLDAMLASQALNLKSVNGYSGNSPKGFDPFWWNPSETTRKQWFNAIHFEPDTLYVVR